MPKSIEQKRIESEQRIRRYFYVDAYRSRKQYKENVRDGYTTFHKDDLRWKMRNFVAASRNFNEFVTKEEKEELLAGWVL